MNSSRDKNVLIVINYFDQRPADDLNKLVESIHRVPPGCRADICVVVNESGQKRANLELSGVRYLYYRENTGMNIGAWQHAWRELPDYTYYLFLQDECVLSRPGWGAAFIDRLSSPSVGLVGESLNPKWDRSWEDLEKKLGHKNADRHELFGKPASRTDVYLNCMRRWNIDPGKTGRHARALVWGFRGETLRALNGFPIGGNYGECIAAEIAVSKMVESLGLQVVQLEEKPFAYIGHSEWGDNSKKEAANKWPRPLRKILKRWRRV